MTLTELIELRKNTYSPEEDKYHSANDFYVGYSTGWQAAYDDILMILKDNGDRIEDIKVTFKSCVR